MSRKPLLQALFTTDPELLGKLAKHQLRSHDLLAAERFFEVAERFALFRPDVPNVEYALSAAQAGFYLYPGLEPEVDIETRADALAFTVRHAFEPAEEPSAEVLAAAATEYISIFQELIPPYRKWIYD